MILISSLKRVLNYLDKCLDNIFANSYKLKVRKGDLILYKDQLLYIEDILMDNQYVCRTLHEDSANHNQVDLSLKSPRTYHFPKLIAVPEKTFKWWSCWMVTETK